MYLKVLRKWWRFWQIDLIVVGLATTYNDAYQEVENSQILYSESGEPIGRTSTISWELKESVKEDIRSQLSTFLISQSLWNSYGKKMMCSKKLAVKFYENLGYDNMATWGPTQLPFYIRDGKIYFDSDLSIKREKVLEELGI